MVEVIGEDETLIEVSVLKAASTSAVEPIELQTTDPPGPPGAAWVSVAGAGEEVPSSPVAQQIGIPSEKEESTTEKDGKPRPAQHRLPALAAAVAPLSPTPEFNPPFAPTSFFPPSIPIYCWLHHPLTKSGTEEEEEKKEEPLVPACPPDVCVSEATQRSLGLNLRKKLFEMAELMPLESVGFDLNLSPQCLLFPYGSGVGGACRCTYTSWRDRMCSTDYKVLIVGDSTFGHLFTKIKDGCDTDGTGAVDDDVGNGGAVPEFHHFSITMDGVAYANQISALVTNPLPVDDEEITHVMFNTGLHHLQLPETQRSFLPKGYIMNYITGLRNVLHIIEDRFPNAKMVWAETHAVCERQYRDDWGAFFTKLAAADHATLSELTHYKNHNSLSGVMAGLLADVGSNHVNARAHALLQSEFPRWTTFPLHYLTDDACVLSAVTDGRHYLPLVGIKALLLSNFIFL
eukprot:TRINITY_DN1714_c0_g1_i5.p1 TRINITY_DN1714_c0_g1~~TRINITY_DN1714_c0_g1_i5.p1  ORF type:complete len:459 (-),score=74.36 TRINITY_DN1714_c0_g1_i5:48-1424(-)